jgi:hypothetical protein
VASQGHPAWLTAAGLTRFQLLKNENVAAYALVPGSSGKKTLLPEIVPLNAIEFEVNLRRPLAESQNRRR